MFPTLWLILYHKIQCNGEQIQDTLETEGPWVQALPASLRCGP